MQCEFRIDANTQVRTLTETDAAQLFQCVDDNRHHLRQWLGWLDMNTTPADTEKFLQLSEQQRENGTGLVNGIFAASNLIGSISFNAIDPRNRSAEIGYWLAEDFQGKGLATRATAGLAEYGFKQLTLHRITLRVATGNHASAAIPRRLGFQHEGTLRDAEWLYDHYVDHELFAMLAPQWRGAPAK